MPPTTIVNDAEVQKIDEDDNFDDDMHDAPDVQVPNSPSQATTEATSPGQGAKRGRSASSKDDDNIESNINIFTRLADLQKAQEERLALANKKAQEDLALTTTQGNDMVMEMLKQGIKEQKEQLDARLKPIENNIISVKHDLDEQRTLLQETIKKVNILQSPPRSSSPDAFFTTYSQALQSSPRGNLASPTLEPAPGGVSPPSNFDSPRVSIHSSSTLGPLAGGSPYGSPLLGSGPSSGDFTRRIDPSVIKLSCKSLGAYDEFEKLAKKLVDDAGLNWKNVSLEGARLGKSYVLRFDGDDDRAQRQVKQVLADQRLSPTNWKTHLITNADNAQANVYINPDKNGRTTACEMGSKSLMGILREKYPSLDFRMRDKANGLITIEWEKFIMLDPSSSTTAEVKSFAPTVEKYKIDMDFIKAEYAKLSRTGPEVLWT